MPAQTISYDPPSKAIRIRGTVLAGRVLAGRINGVEIARIYLCGLTEILYFTPDSEKPAVSYCVRKKPLEGNPPRAFSMDGAEGRT